MSTIGPSTATSSGSAASSAPSMESSRPSKPSTASDIALPKNDEGDLLVRWSRRWTITHRIMAVNIFALAILAGSIFYLDSFRTRLTTARVTETESAALMVADALSMTPEPKWPALLTMLGDDSKLRLRVYGPSGGKQADSWLGAPATYT